MRRTTGSWGNISCHYCAKFSVFLRDQKPTCCTIWTGNTATAKTNQLKQRSLFFIFFIYLDYWFWVWFFLINSEFSRNVKNSQKQTNKRIHLKYSKIRHGTDLIHRIRYRGKKNELDLILEQKGKISVQTGDVLRDYFCMIFFVIFIIYDIYYICSDSLFLWCCSFFSSSVFFPAFKKRTI